MVSKPAPMAMAVQLSCNRNSEYVGNRRVVGVIDDFLSLWQPDWHKAQYTGGFGKSGDLYWNFDAEVDARNYPWQS